MGNFLIKGGKKLKGEITTNASKNATMAVMNAALLNQGVTTLKNVPQIEEVYRIIEVFSSIGVSCEWIDKKVLRITPPKIFDLENINHDSAAKTRSVVYLLAVMSHHLKSFEVPQTGGCKLGSRTVKPHMYALQELGITVETTSTSYQVSAKNKRPAENLVLYEAGDTVTVNSVLAAAVIPGTTTVRFGTANYMVQDVCSFLQLCGVAIDGIGTTSLTVHGVEYINQNIEYTISEDPIESMLFLAIAATTNSGITIKRCPIEFLEIELLKLEKMGFKYTRSDVYLSSNKVTKLVDITTQPSKLVALEEKIHPAPYPGLNIDNLPFFAPIATQAEGRTFIFDWVYENRAIYFTELNKLRAEVTLIDPHRILIDGPTKLKGCEIICPPALRPGTVIMVAMLAAEGESLLRNIYSIERGYEDLCQRLRTIGADIQRVDKID